MYVIGLTGNIATGKSTVAWILQDLGAHLIDADALVHRLMEPGTEVSRQVVEAFGEEMAGRGGAIDRSRLGELVFTDPDSLRELEGIVHPAVARDVESLLQRIEEDSGNGDSAVPEEEPAEPVVVLEAIKLFESGLAEECDVVWVVASARELQQERLVRHRRLSPRQAAARIDAQPPQYEKMKLADVLIYNEGSLDELRDRVEEEWRQVLAKLGKG